MKGLILLISFMTRLPVPNIKFEEEKLGKAMKFFPIVGIIIGFILLAFTYLILIISKNMSVATTLPVTIVTVILVDIILTGGLHLDGLADTFDGIFSYRSKQKMLEIMKDSRLGSNGALALILYFIIKFILLLAIAMEYNKIYFLFSVLTYPVVARFCSVVSCASVPYAKSVGMGKTFADNTKMLEVFIAFLITTIFVVGIFSYNTTTIVINIFIIVILGLVSYGFSKLIERKIGGITGDTLGALVELSSLLYLFLILYIPSFDFML